MPTKNTIGLHISRLKLISLRIIQNINIKVSIVLFKLKILFMISFV